ncbi:hypothetical protein SFOMI_2297 [Sphingobium fuliginis]|uniref:Uncharacterized protein n=1 Tax=Sphingobium fuliginis (strain ATCC 27551) TaxID=336203 RepID=A0A292ZFV8_SPHSA|nr:hypothetical protein SFOMI_2297 [Sphingobium fuliginis]
MACAVHDRPATYHQVKLGGHKSLSDGCSLSIIISKWCLIFTCIVRFMQDRWR